MSAMLVRGLARLTAHPAAASATTWGSARTMASHGDPKPWNYLWKPGPYPKTQEERERAAKKYGMIVEDYEPYPDDGVGAGDYPKLKPSSGDSRSGFEDWDFPQLRRNYGEPMHFEFQNTTDRGIDDTTRKRYTTLQFIGIFFVCLASMVVPIALATPFPHFPPLAEPQVPGKGKKHYTFETVE